MSGVTRHVLAFQNPAHSRAPAIRISHAIEQGGTPTPGGSSPPVERSTSRDRRGHAARPPFVRFRAAFHQFEPDVLMPAHCTGWKATHQLAARFPDAYIANSVGTTIVL
jgi:hypothetical protein